MADMNKNEDTPQAPTSRPRPEVKRTTIPPPGGLPMPPSRQESVSQFQRQLQEQIDQALQQSSASSSSELLGSGSTTSNIPTPSLPLSESFDVFGLPAFRFPIASTSKTRFGFSEIDISSIKSPTHLPKLANLTVPNLFGGISARSGSVGSILSPTVQLPMPPNAKSSSDLTTRDLPGMSVSSALSDKDLLRLAPRPSDLSLSNVTITNLSSDPDPNDIPGTSDNNFPITSDKSSNMWTSDRTPEPNLQSITLSMPRPSVSKSNPESRRPSAMIDLPSASVSIHEPGSSSNTSSDPQGKLDVKRSSDPLPVPLQDPSEIRRDSMSSIPQHINTLPKSKSMYSKFKNFLKKGLNVKKTKGVPEEESTGLVFEREEDEPRPPQPSHKEPEREVKHIKVDPFGRWLKKKPPALPYIEVEKKCYYCDSFTIGSPTVSVLSNTSTSKSESDLGSIGSPSSLATDQMSKSNPTSPGSERKCTCYSASETSESASTISPTAEVSETPPVINVITEISETPTMINVTPDVLETATTSYATPEISQLASTSNVIPEISETATGNATPEISETIND